MLLTYLIHGINLIHSCTLIMLLCVHYFHSVGLRLAYVKTRKPDVTQLSETWRNTGGWINALKVNKRQLQLQP